MKLNSRFAVPLLLLLLATPAWAQQNPTLDKAVAWLVEQQDESGAFKSKHYGAMKQGSALTSLSLYSLLMTPRRYRRANSEAIEKAIAFLMPGTKARGRVANPDGSLDHPVYSTAMFLTASRRFENRLDRELANTLLKYLVDSQCTEGRGFDPSNPNYGGWDVIGPDVMPNKTSGTNVSVTRFVLEAMDVWISDATLDEATQVLVEASQEKAKGWLQRLQKRSPAGGFFFTAQPGSALNKAKSSDGKPKAYATATCDGFLAHVLLGENYWGNDDSAELKTWIKTNITTGSVCGFEEDDQTGWPKALHYYHLQGLAGIANPRSLLMPNVWSKKICLEIEASLAKAQKDDGRFENESSLMRENDPLIATSFAIISLSRTRR